MILKIRKRMLTSIVLVTVVAALLYSIFYLFLGLLYVEPLKAAPSWVNDTLIVKVNVTNYAPKVVGVVVDDSTPSPADEINLVSGSVRRVFCNGTVVDWNGKDDIVAVNATLYYNKNKSTSQNDMNEHYSNRSCALVRSYIYNETYTCGFNVWFFANNGTWYCNMSAWDNATADFRHMQAFNSSIDLVKVNPLYGLEVPPLINFGELALNAESNPHKVVNVTNTGNMKIDLNLWGYGGTKDYRVEPVENNLSMKCTMGNISIRNLRFDTNQSVDPWTSMTNLSGQRFNPKVVNFNLAQRRSETTNSTNNTYWKIKIPQYTAKGQCNGTVVFVATVG